MTEPRELVLTEFRRVDVPRADLPFPVAERLWRDHGNRVRVEFPSPKTGGMWQLTNLGAAGYLPLTADLGLRLEPKVPVGNLFRMLAYAYDVRDLQFLPDLASFQSIHDVYEHLAVLLAQAVLERARKGLHRAYEPRAARLQHLRGRIDVGAAVRAPWVVGLPVRFSEHTADNDDNRLLAWTLERIVRSGLCSGSALRVVQRAHRTLHGTVSAPPFRARDAIGRTYSRLNADYETLHALCWFFLEHAGPTHQRGESRLQPFVVDMAPLFERFVAAWLRGHLPPRLALSTQKSLTVGGRGGPTFRIDLVITDRDTGRTVCVADTKYKEPGKVDPADVAQVVTYAGLMDTREAVLLYPDASGFRLDGAVGDVRVRSLAFDLSATIETAGDDLLRQLLGSQSEGDALSALTA